MIEDEYTNDDGNTMQEIKTMRWHYIDEKKKAWDEYWKNKSLEKLLIARLAEREAADLEIAYVEMQIKMDELKMLLPIVTKKPKRKQKEST
jgi:hypothetical protein